MAWPLPVKKSVPSSAPHTSSGHGALYLAVLLQSFSSCSLFIPHYSLLRVSGLGANTCEALRQRGTMQCFAFIRSLTRSTMQSHIGLGGAQVHRHSSVFDGSDDQSRQARYRAFRQRSFPFNVSVRVRGEACLILRFQAATASLVQRNSVPSSHMRCSTVARRRATATQARFSPRFLARRRPQALSHDGALVLVSSAMEAS